MPTAMAIDVQHGFLYGRRFFPYQDKKQKREKKRIVLGIMIHSAEINRNKQKCRKGSRFRPIPENKFPTEALP